MSNSNEGNVKEGLYYLFLIISLILCACSLLVNLGSIHDMYGKQGYSDIYIFLEHKKAVYYSIVWSIVFAVLLGLMSYYSSKGRRAVAVKICLIYLFAMLASGFLYKVMINFREP